MTKESVFTTIKNLAQSGLDDFEEMDVEQQLDFVKDILKQIQNVCDKVEDTHYYVLMDEQTRNSCEYDYFELHTEEEIKKIFVEHGFISEDEVDELELDDLYEIAEEELYTIQDVGNITNAITL